jgi:16S rRNA (uracil1498-N3)-methyltransferase
VAGALDGLRGPLVFVDDIAAPSLSDEDRHHLDRVLRLAVGSPLVAADGRGSFRPGRLGTDLEPIGAVGEVARAEPAIAVAFAVTKGARPELAVQKLTELGVDRIVPFTAARSVARWHDERAGRRGARLEAVARAAAMQSRRCWLPQVDPVTNFAEAVTLPGAALAVPGGEPPTLAHPSVLVGPEGGWADDELAAGLPQVALGDGVLRAETAAITAGALLAALRAGLVGPSTSLRTR